MSQTLNMTQGNPLKLLVRFSLPLMAANIFQQLYTVVDTAIVGKGVGMDALAALGCVDWTIWLILGIAYGFTQGFSVRIAQKFGEGDEAGLKLFVGQSLVLSAVLAVICTALSQLCLPLLLWLLHVPEDLAPMSELYCRIIFGGMPIVFCVNYCSAALRAVGDSKTPMIGTAVAAVTNIVLDIIAVFVLKWGIAGAAAATLIAQALSGVICLGKMLRIPQLRFQKSDLSLHRDVQMNLLRIGFPAALKNIIISVGGMMINSVANTFGTTFIAGYIASAKLYGLLEIAALSYGYSVNTYVGQNYGAMRYDRIKSGMKSATILAIVTSVVISALMFLFGRPITMLFISTENPAQAMEAGNVAYTYLCVMASCLPVLYLLYLYVFALQGLGDMMRTMVSGGIELGCRVVVAMVVAYTGYEMGVFGAEVIAWIGAAAYMGYHFRKHMKRLLRT